MKIKHSIILIFLVSIGTKTFATPEYTTHICYIADTATGRSYMPADRIEYLKPEIFFGNFAFDLEHKGEIIMDWLAEYSSIFEYDSVKVEKNHLSVFLKTTKLSVVERQELITSLLLNGCKYVTVVFSNGVKITHSHSDIHTSFFLPVYFYDELFDDGLFVNNALELLRIYETDLHYNITHIVEAGETIYGIAKLYDISQKELIENNPEIENSPLQIGQELIIYQKKEHEASENQTDSKSKNCSIAVWLLLGISILLDVWLIWKFYAKKK